MTTISQSFLSFDPRLAEAELGLVSPIAEPFFGGDTVGAIRSVKW